MEDKLKSHPLLRDNSTFSKSDFDIKIMNLLALNYRLFQCWYFLKGPEGSIIVMCKECFRVHLARMKEKDSFSLVCRCVSKSRPEKHSCFSSGFAAYTYHQPIYVIKHGYYKVFLYSSYFDMT